MTPNQFTIALTGVHVLFTVQCHPLVHIGDSNQKIGGDVSVSGVSQAIAHDFERPRSIRRSRSQADRAYRTVATGSGLL